MLGQEYDFSTYYHTPEDTLAHLEPPYLAKMARAVAATLGHLAVRTDTPTLSIDTPSVVEGNEGQATLTFDVTLVPAASETVTVDFATAAETATEGVDFLPTSGSITFAPGETSHSLSVAVLGDTDLEDSETLSVLLSNPTNAVLGDHWGTGTIVADEHEIRAWPASAREGDSGQRDASLPVALWPSCAYSACLEEATVDYATEDVTATGNVDYLRVSGTLTFPAGGGLQYVAVPILGDTLYEDDETFSLLLSNPSREPLATPSVTGTILDDDAGGVVEFSKPTIDVAERASQVTVRVSRTGGAAVPISVRYAIAAATATEGADYRGTAGVVDFAVNQYVRTFSVPLLDDRLAEGTETVRLILSDPGGFAHLGPNAEASLRILDDDRAGVLGFSAARISGSETARAAVVTLVRSGGQSAGVTVDYATADGTAVAGEDYTARAGTLTFAAGVLRQTFSVPIVDDGAAEGAETLVLSLLRPTGGAALGPQAQAVLSILDNEPVVRFGAVAYTARESARLATVTLIRSGPAGVEVSVDHTTSDGTATAAGSDYTPAAGTVTFPAGVLTRTLTVEIGNDGLGEPAETVNLALSNPVGASLGTPASATLTILDDEPVVQLAAAAYAARESAGSATIAVRRSGSLAPFTVDFTTSDGTASAAEGDYTAAAGTLTFAAGQASATIAVRIGNDSLGEGPETLGVALTAATGALLGARRSALVTILDDEPAVQFSASTYSASESAGFATITVVRTGSLASLTVDFAASDGTATAASGDYVAAAGTLTFAAGVMSRTFRVTVGTDSAPEGDETVQLTLTAPSGVFLGPRSTAILTIRDDEAGVQFGAVRYVALESAAAAVVTVTRLSGAAPFTVDYRTEDGSARAADGDYSSTGGTLSFGAGVVARTFTVPIREDTLDEGDEDVQLILEDATGAFIGPRASATLVIRDNDVGGTVGFDSVAWVGSEGQGLVQVTVRRTGGLAGGVTVDCATSDGTARVGEDYLAASATLTFAAGETTQTFTLTIVEDDLAEYSESIILTLTNVQGGALLGPLGAATLAIVDDDPVSLP